MNQFSSLGCVFIDDFPFVLGIFLRNGSHWNNGTFMQKPQLPAFTILVFDKTIFQRTLTGHIAFQPIFKLFIDTEGKPSKVCCCFMLAVAFLMWRYQKQILHFTDRLMEKRKKHHGKQHTDISES